MSLIAREGDLAFRRMTEHDLHMMVGWLSDPKILEWYIGRDQVFDLARARAKFLNDEELVPCIVELCADHDAEPIGYIQYYEAIGDVKASFGYAPERSVYGIDVFIGRHDLWGRGIGTRLVSLAVRFLRETFDPDHVVIDPRAENSRAIRVYEKSGFTPVRTLEQFELHEGRMWDTVLMEHHPRG